MDVATTLSTARGVLGAKSTEQQIEITSWTTGVLVFLVALWALFGPKLGRLHLTEGSAACLFGLLCGSLLLAGRHYIAQQAVVQRLLAFSAASFFTYLLPPVIFYAGLSIEKTLFFSNLGSILALGVLGTAISALVLAALLAAGFAGFRLLRIQDCLALGAIFSATDSVATLQVLNPDKQPVLFALVFGEGVINDATSVVLLGAVSSMFPTPGTAAAAGAVDPAAATTGTGSETHGWDSLGGVALTFLYLFTTSLALGVATGSAISCLVVRFAAHGPHHEVALIGLLSYLSYLVAEVLGLSGILSLFCCGLTVSQFGLENISDIGKSTTLNAFHTMSYICEGIIFIYLGMDALDPAKWHAAHPGEAISLCGALLVILLVARAVSVLPITALHNWLHPVKLSPTDIVIVWWSGLMRGAVSVALAYYYFDIGAPQGSTGDRHYSTLIVATLVVVLVTVLLLGAATQPLLQILVEDPDLPIMTKVVRYVTETRTKVVDGFKWFVGLFACCCGGAARVLGFRQDGLAVAKRSGEDGLGSRRAWFRTGNTSSPGSPKSWSMGHWWGFQKVATSDSEGSSGHPDVDSTRGDQEHRLRHGDLELGAGTVLSKAGVAGGAAGSSSKGGGQPDQSRRTTADEGSGEWSSRGTSDSKQDAAGSNVHHSASMPGTRNERSRQPRSHRLAGTTSSDVTDHVRSTSMSPVRLDRSHVEANNPVAGVAGTRWDASASATQQTHQSGGVMGNDSGSSAGNATIARSGSGLPPRVAPANKPHLATAKPCQD